MIRFLLVLFLVSCGPVGPNYNVGRTNNESLILRERVVMREDSRVKRNMNRARVKANNNRKRSYKKSNRKYK
jgi:hypothetical protein